MASTGRLARLQPGGLGQLSVIAERLPDIIRQGAPRPLRSMFINGIKSLPVRYTS
jgi:hypothetical protein